MHTQTTSGEFSSSRRPLIGTDEIILIVAGYYGMPSKDLISKSRKQKTNRPRQVAMYLARQWLIVPGWLGSPKVASRFGGRDHSTFFHGARRIEKLKSKDDGVRMAVAEISEYIQRVEREAHGLVDDNGQPIAPLDYIQSQRHLIVKPPDSIEVSTPPSSTFTPPNQKIISVQVEDIQRVIAEYYEVSINWCALRDTEDDVFYQQVFDYLAARINRECWQRAQVRDSNGRYSAPESSRRAITQLLDQARKNQCIREDLETLWGTVKALLSSTT